MGTYLFLFRYYELSVKVFYIALPSTYLAKRGCNVVSNLIEKIGFGYYKFAIDSSSKLSLKISDFCT
ncbi:unnamed protein product [Callosobruchus maculatus]|uniref:Uncharacterized protein n=1 Tax=Callosobruchus maculatus TaxID=64391 RepID=A0A653CM80_CALMS|nr:unnamed protein product [Callosobruchus maculatus]